MKKNKLQIAKANGVKLYPFKGATSTQAFNVPKGAIYGVVHDMYVVCVTLPHYEDTTVKVYTYDQRFHVWQLRTFSRYYHDEIIKTHGNSMWAEVHSQIAYAILEVVKACPTLRVERFRPEVCHHNIVRSGVLPRERRPQKYMPMKDLYAQRCVDGKGYSECTSGEYQGAMKEHFAQGFKEDLYWATFKAR